jgi:hypothetical protein
MAFRPGTAVGRHHSTEHAYIFFGKSPEEVNNYSGWMTRRKCDYEGSFEPPTSTSERSFYDIEVIIFDN